MAKPPPQPILSLQTVLFHAAWSAIRILVGYKALAEGGGALFVGLSAGLISLPGLFAALPLGRTADRIGGSLISTAGLAVLICSVSGLLLLPGLPVLAVASFFLGAGHLLVMVGQQTYAAHRSEGPSDSSFGSLTAAASLGQLTGPLMVTLVLSLIHPDESPGLDPAAANLGLLVAIGFAALALPCHLILRTADILERQNRPGTLPAQLSLRRLLRTSGVMKSTLVSAMVLVSVDLLYTFLPIWASEKNIAMSTVTWLLALRAGISLVSRLGLGALIARTGRRPLLQVTVILAAASMFCFPFVDLPGAIVITILLGIGLGIPQPLTMAWTSSLVQPTAQGAALGLRLTANRFAQTTVPLILGVASVPLGMPGIFCLGSLLLLGSACAIDGTTGTGDGRRR
jgi:MFS family permease